MTKSTYSDDGWFFRTVDRRFDFETRWEAQGQGTAGSQSAGNSQVDASHVAAVGAQQQQQQGAQQQQEGHQQAQAQAPDTDTGEEKEKPLDFHFEFAHPVHGQFNGVPTFSTHPLAWARERY